MKVKIKLVDRTLPVPEYKTVGAVGFDLYLRNDETIAPHQVVRMPANVVIQIPKGHFLLINGRSSTPMKFGLLIFTGIIDPDFCGDEDEFSIQAMNLTNKTVRLEKGLRIAQGILIKISKADFNVVDRMGNKSRGGYGTTGHK